MMDIRNEMMQTMIECGMSIEAQHHEVATAGQSEIDMKFDNLVAMADKVMMYKYIIKNVAKKYGKTVTFMPKPLFGDNGSGMHTHISIWKGGKPLFAGSGYAGLSDMAIVRHRRHSQARPGAVRHSATRPPTATSGWCPASRRRSTWPIRSETARPPSASRCTARIPKAKRLEFRCPDPSCNPYLSFSAMLMAAIDGIQNKIDPGEPLDKDIYDLDARGDWRTCRRRPARWKSRSKALRADHEFLLRGDVFTPDVIDTWIWYKTVNEVAGDAVASASLRVLLVL